MLPRQAHIDALKFLAANAIVLHHFSIYGPLSQGLAEVAASLSFWLSAHALKLVHVFLAAGGFLAARALSMPSQLSQPWHRLVLQRYTRTMPAFAAALALAVLCAWLARPWLGGDDTVPLPPSLAQVLAHLSFLQGILGHDALSAGVWYVAMDFQLYALLAALLAWRPRWAWPLVLVLTAASLLFFNRQSGWDDWAVFFFGSYGLGALAFRVAHSPRAGAGLAALALLGLLALVLEMRDRLLLALATALWLGWLESRPPAAGAAPGIFQGVVEWMARQGRLSYALFLVHFPVLMLANALYAGLGRHSAHEALGFILLAWLASTACALAFFRGVEVPLLQWLRDRRQLRPAHPGAGRAA